jgi:two-component system, NarL family, response regulator DesR
VIVLKTALAGRLLPGAPERASAEAEIADRLILSEGTVRNHLSVAIQKLGVRNRVEAARLAEQKGWL